MNPRTGLKGQSYGNTGTPSGETVTVHHLLAVDEHSWTVTLDVWNRGGGA